MQAHHLLLTAGLILVGAGLYLGFGARLETDAIRAAEARLSGDAVLAARSYVAWGQRLRQIAGDRTRRDARIALEARKRAARRRQTLGELAGLLGVAGIGGGLLLMHMRGEIEEMEARFHDLGPIPTDEVRVLPLGGETHR